MRSLSINGRNDLGLRALQVISEHKLEIFVKEHGEMELLGLVEDTSEGKIGYLTGQFMLSLLLYVGLHLIRAFVIATLSPILKKTGYGLSVKEAAVMVWGGLRGAVSLSLACLVDGNHLIGERSREMIFIQTIAVVSLTLLVNGTTAGMVYKALQVYPSNPFRPILATQGLRNLQLEIDKAARQLRKHWFYSNADIECLQHLIPNFNNAQIYDGDLIDVDLVRDPTTWTISISQKDGPNHLGLRYNVLPEHQWP